MKKILTAFNAINTPWHVITFVTKFAKQHSSSVHAIFLNTKKEAVNSEYPFPNDLFVTEKNLTDESIAYSNNKVTDDNIKIFKDECDVAGITFSSDKNVSIQQLIDQTANAGLLIVDSKSDFLENLLPHIHCPTLLASASELPQKVVLMYDESPSAKLAIEMYASLLSEFRDLPTFLLSINAEKKDNTENELYFKEKLQPNFTNLSFKNLHGNVEHETENFIAELPGHVLVVMGAFGRSALSRFFHQSLANKILDKPSVSLFMAHK